MESSMCPSCSKGRLHQGQAPMIFRHEIRTVIVKDVPAEICSECGERFISEEVTDRITRISQEALETGPKTQEFRYESL